MDAKWQVNPEVLSSKIDDEAILMSFEAESYFGLEPVASRIWEILSKEPLTINELVLVLMEEYEIDKITCTEDVQHFMDEMLIKKLIIQMKPV